MKCHQCIVTVLATRRTIIIHHNQDIVEYTITIKVVGAYLHKKDRFHDLFFFQVQSANIWSTSSVKITGCVKAQRFDLCQSVLGIIIKEVPRIEVFFYLSK